MGKIFCKSGIVVIGITAGAARIAGNNFHALCHDIVVVEEEEMREHLPEHHGRDCLFWRRGHFCEDSGVP